MSDFGGWRMSDFAVGGQEMGGICRGGSGVPSQRWEMRAVGSVGGGVSGGFERSKLGVWAGQFKKTRRQEDRKTRGRVHKGLCRKQHSNDQPECVSQRG